MDMFNALGLLLILLSPFCMGLPWVKAGGAESAVAKACFACVAGYFMRLALFHAVALPMTVLGLRFSTMANVFTVLLVGACLVCAWLGRDAFRNGEKQPKFTAFDRIYLLAFITNPQTGLFRALDFRALQSALLFPAYISRMAGMPVTMVERTFSYGLNLLLAYGCYVYMAEDLYRQREDRLIFLILLSGAYIFGYHSSYSMTFRLLGPNSQGKAILAVTVVPLLFVMLRKWLDRPYQWKCGLFLFFLSDSACALSLMGTGYVIAIVVLLTVLSLFRRQRQWKHLLYALWAGVMPCAYMASYILLKNLI